MPKLNIIEPRLKPALVAYGRLISSSTLHYLLFLILFLVGFPLASIQAQEAASPTESEAIEDTTVAPTQTGSIFSIEGGNQLLTEAEEAVDNQQYDLAAEKLQSARQVFNQLSNFYLQLFNSFSGLDNAAAESHRQKALETGVQRDKATYQLALVHRAQEQPELSVPLLVQIITSQSPGTVMGKRAYEQLLDIGFVDVPFTTPTPRPPASDSEPPAGTPQPQTPEAQPQAPQVQPQVPSPQ